VFLMSEVPLYLGGGIGEGEDDGRLVDLFIDNSLVRIHFIIVMIRWIGQ